MVSTGETCHEPGVYRTDCSDRALVPIGQGDRFPPCPDCRRAVEWALILPTGRRVH